MEKAKGVAMEDAQPRQGPSSGSRVRHPLAAELAVVPQEAQPPRLHRATPGVVLLL
jgi:hypothetical protein